MRRILLGVLLVANFLAVPAAASAETITVSQKIKVTAVVPDLRYIIVDSSGQILEVGSNTNSNVSPTVFVGSITSNPQTPSQQLLDKYNFILASSPKKIGVLYRSPSGLSKTTQMLALNLRI